MATLAERGTYAVHAQQTLIGKDLWPATEIGPENESPRSVPLHAECRTKDGIRKRNARVAHYRIVHGKVVFE